MASTASDASTSCPLTREDIEEFARCFQEAKEAAILEGGGESMFSWADISVYELIRGNGKMKQLQKSYEQLANITKQVVSPFVKKHPTFKVRDQSAELPWSAGKKVPIVPVLNFRCAHFSNDADLQGIFLMGSIFDEAHFEGANFSGACLTNASLRSVKCEYNSMTYVWAESCDWQGSKFNGSNFQYAWLESSRFHQCEFKDTKMKGAQFKDAKWDPFPLVSLNNSSLNFGNHSDGYAGLSGEVVGCSDVSKFEMAISKPTKYSPGGISTVMKQVFLVQSDDMARDVFELEEISEVIAKLQMSVSTTSWDEVCDFFKCLYNVGFKAEGELSKAITFHIFEDDIVQKSIGFGVMLQHITCPEAPPDDTVVLMKRASGIVKLVSGSIRKRVAEEKARIQRIKEYQERLVAVIGSAILAGFVSIGNFISNYLLHEYLRVDA